MSKFIDTNDISKETFERALRVSSYEIGLYFYNRRVQEGVDVAYVSIPPNATVKKIITLLQTYTGCDFETTRNIAAQYVAGMSYEELTGREISNTDTNMTKTVKRFVGKKNVPNTEQGHVTVDAGLYEGLSPGYRQLLESLEPEDQQLYLRHRDDYKSWGKELVSLFSLAADIAARQGDVRAEYGQKLIDTLAILYGISDSALFFAIRLVRIFTHERLIGIVDQAKERCVRLTLSHLRAFSRIGSDEWAEQRESLVEKLLNGEFLTSRNVERAVDEVLGVTPESKESVAADLMTVDIFDPVDFDTKPATVKPKTKEIGNESDKDEEYVDALEPVSPPSEIVGLCENCVANVKTFDDRFDKWYQRLLSWREDASIDTLENLRVDVIENAMSQLSSHIQKIRDAELLLQSISETASGTQREAMSVNRNVPVSLPRTPVDEADRHYAMT
jgi:hypothetical protein